MADTLSAGVFIEEVQTAAQIVPGVTTSNMGIVGYAARGPANVAVLVQSFEQYTRTFGGLVSQSRMPLSIAAFFANGGRRAYVVRVPPADAVAAQANIQSVRKNELVAEGDGTTTPIVGSVNTASGAAPVVPASFTVEWRQAGTPVLAQNTRNRDNTANLALVDGQASYEGRINPSSLPAFDSRLDAVERGTVTITFDVAASTGGPTQSVSIPVGTSAIAQGSVGDATNGAVVVLDHRSGRFSLRTFGNFVPAVADDGNLVTADFTPTSATRTAQDALASIQVVAGSLLVDAETVVIDDGVTAPITFEFDSNGIATGVPVPFSGTDTAEQVRDALVSAINTSTTLLLRAEAVSGSTNKLRLLPKSSTSPGAVLLSDTVAAAGFVVAPTTASSEGLWVGDVSAPGSINYSTGAFSIPVAGFVPHVKSPILATYTRAAWTLNPISVGAWGNDVRVRLSGSPNFFDAPTGTYSRFDVVVELLNPQTGNFEAAEQYEELVFDDPTSPVYFADVLNELSDLVTVQEPAGDEAPGQLAATPVSVVLAGGNGLAPNRAVSAVLPGVPLQPRTIVVSYTDTSGTARSITDNGTGALVGDVDASPGVVNEVNYTTGSVSFTTGFPIRGGSLVVASYRSAPALTSQVERFGDSTKLYKQGSEGTFDGINWGRDQFTNAATLVSSNGGMYAFNRVEEILHIVIPDYAGNSLIASDQLDYAATRAASASGGDRFIILTTPAGYDAQQAVDWLRFSLGRNSDYAAVYWPWVRVADPLNNNRPTTFPPLAHIAGIYARTDATRNVGKSPGGTVDGALNYIVGMERTTTLEERNIVYPNRINPLIDSTQTGRAVWGVRTISNVPDWRYINARRLFMFLQKSIYNATWWTTFENNGPALWSKISAQIGSFLSNLFSQGYFAGTSPAQAYFVVCDASNNTPETIEAGQIIVDVGVAPNKPAEFVRIRFQQKSLNS
jgi:phage tail sheath protein FI